MRRRRFAEDFGDLLATLWPAFMRKPSSVKQSVTAVDDL
jgi:hypothetical protein